MGIGLGAWEWDWEPENGVGSLGMGPYCDASSNSTCMYIYCRACVPIVDY